MSDELANQLQLLVKRFPPIPYRLTDTDGGPEAVVEAYRNNQPIPVYTGDSDNTIWGSPEMNWLVRAHHDSIHLLYNVPFTKLGEYTAAEISSALAELMGLKELARTIRVDIAGFSAHEADTNEFAEQTLAKDLLSLIDNVVACELDRTA